MLERKKYFGKKRLYPETSLYSFYFIAIKKGWKLRKLGKIVPNDITNFIANTKVLKRVVKKFKHEKNNVLV